MGLKILHTADWHLDSPLVGFTREQRQVLKENLRKIPETVAQLCRRENCDLLLVAGDVFDGPASRESVDILKDALGSCGVPVVITPGNHDFCAPGSPWLEEAWPENVHVFKGGLESLVIKDLDCRIYGAGYTSMDCPGLLECFRAKGDEPYQIGVLHGDPVQLRSPYCPITAAQVRDSGLNYLALGHIHKGGSFRGGKTLCAWPGSPMGRGYDETGEKGVYLVELEETAKIQFLPLDTPRFYDLTIDSGEDAALALEDALPAAGSDDFYRITLTGSSDSDVTAVCGKFPNLELRDRREAGVELWASAGEDTLEGTFFALLRQEAEAGNETALLAAKISRRLLDGKEVTLP